MQKKCDTSFQLNFDFESTTDPVVMPDIVDNVIHVKFGEKSHKSFNKSKEDLEVLERVLLNARKLKW